jgi:hypothetical protein
MGLEVLIASLFANLITRFTKPSRSVFDTPEGMAARKMLVRAINAALGIAALVVASIMLGEPLDATQVQTYVEIIVTFIASQGFYFLGRKES